MPFVLNSYCNDTNTKDRRLDTKNTATLKENTYFDIVISGGGLSGLLTAIGLCHECPQLRVAIVEPTPAHAEQASISGTAATQHLKKHSVDGQAQEPVTENFDGRCIALSYGTLKLLQHWSIWPNLKMHAWPIKTIVTSDKGHIGKTILKATDFGINAMGNVAEMRNIGRAFHLTAKQHAQGAQISWFNEAEITDVSQQCAQFSKLTLSTGVQLTTKLMVVAEGGRSVTKTRLNIKNEAVDYNQTAIVANIKTSGATAKLNRLLRHPNTPQQDKHGHDIAIAIADSCAFERFTTHGPIALLPIGPQQYSLVWTEEPEQAQQLLALSDADFCQALQKEFGYGAGKIVTVGDRASFPLYLSKSQALIHNRIALLGNAAHTVHPIAGQGFNLGVRDIAVLVNEVKQAFAVNQDIGSVEVLNRYQNNRLDDINRITDFTDSLVRLFGLEGRLPAFARTMGLMALQKLDPLQQWLALHFMGSQSAKNIPQLLSLNKPQVENKQGQGISP